MCPFRTLAKGLWLFGYSNFCSEVQPSLVGILKKMSRISSRYLWQLQIPRIRNFQRSIYGVYLKKRSKDLTYRYCLFGTYGQFISNKLRDISSPSIFLDIGANIGLFSLIAQKIDHIVRIYSFEPSLENHRYFLQNIEINSANKITSFPFAVSDFSGPIFLKYDAKHSGGSSVVESTDSNDVTNTLAVNHTFLNEHCFVSDESVLAKIDVEGHELQVIKSLMNWRHSGKIKSIIVEFDTKRSRIIDCESLLTLHGFTETSRCGNSKHWDAVWERVQLAEL